MVESDHKEKKGKEMGNLSAIAMSDEALGISLELQLTWHLQSNHCPAIPVSMVPVCIEAIDAFNEGAEGTMIDLPSGVYYRGENRAPAGVIVDQHHLWAWIIESEMY